MAEGETGTSWLGSWLDSAKAKTQSAFDMMKKDLGEFSSTMQHDTVNAASSLKQKVNHENATAAGLKVKDGVSNLLGGISKVLVVEAEDPDKKLLQTKSKMTAEPIFDRAKARLNAIQMDPATYCNEPDGPKEDFEDWVKTFELDSKKGDISDLLVINTDVRSLYTQMVPSSVSHADFWQRYFYKLHQLQLDEQRRAALMKRANESEIEKEDLDWEDEWCDVTGSSSQSQTLQNDKKTTEVETKEHLPSAQVTEKKDTIIAHDNVEMSKESSDDTLIKDETVDDTATKVDSLSQVESNNESDLNIDSIDKSQSNKQEFLPLKVKVEPSELKTKMKGDMVVVGSAETTPSSDSATTGKDTTDDDWEKEFDIEVTEEDLKLANEAASELSTNNDNEDDWESWE